MKKFVVVLLFSLLSSTAIAKEQYVIDVLYITLRAGQGDEFKVLTSLKSGTALETLEVSEEGYTLVKTPEGLEGWVKTKYITDEPVAIIRADKLQVQNDALVAENNELKEQHSQAKLKVKEAEKERKRLESKSQNLQKEHDRLQAISAKPAQLAKENKEFLTKNTAMKTELNQLREESDLHSGKASRDWFLAGAGVLIFGLVIGLVLPSIRWRKRNSW